MQRFYSIISISPNPVTNDQVAIGLVVWLGDRFWYRFADWKIAEIKGILPISPKNLKAILSQIALQLEFKNTKTVEIKPLDASYFQYLNQYSHGLIRFAEPQVIAEISSEHECLRLYRLLVDSRDLDEKQKTVAQSGSIEFNHRIQSSLIAPLREKVHTQYKLTGEQLPGLYFDFEVDCIGQNGRIYAAKSLDLSNVGFVTNDKHLNHFNTVTHVLNSHYGDRNEYFVIADEPSQVESKVYQQWEAIQKMPWLKLVPSKDAQEVSDLILRSNAKKFLS